MTTKMRLEKDLLGELEVPDDVYWGINTQRALKNFQISQRKFPEIFLLSLAQIKKACLFANQKLKVIDDEKVKAIEQALDELLIEHKFLDQFPIDVFQTGSGTQINMNMNEVLANRANEILGFPKGKKTPIHPNDHINKSQSSNDVIPTAMHLSSIIALTENLIPIIELLLEVLKKKIDEFKNVVKIGRTHLQDAVPIKLSTEFSVYLKQIYASEKRLGYVLEELYEVPIGGTALGTGLNAPKGFDKLTIELLTTFTHIPFRINPVKAEGISSHNTLVYLSSVLKLLALSLMKMANDIRWMGSGPRAGLGELILPENEPGSSIMPGKINPTQSEALLQVCLQVIGYDTTISYAEAYGSVLDLNTTKPLMIINILDSISLLTSSIHSFTNNCLKEIKPNIKIIKKNLENSLMIVTKLTPYIGYEKAGEIAKKAYETGKTIKEIIVEMNIQLNGNLEDILDPNKMV